MTNLRAHLAFLTPDFSTTFTCFLRSQGNSPQIAEVGEMQTGNVSKKQTAENPRL